LIGGSNSRYENYVWVLLAWIAKSKPTSQDLAILRSHNGNCWIGGESLRLFDIQIFKVEEEKFISLLYKES
jgi:hypothetical protein